MSPERAKIFIVEDDHFYLITLLEILEREGHTIAFTAESLESALEIITQMTSEEVDIGLFDDSLKLDDNKNHDGAKVAQAFRDKFPIKPVLGISMGEVEWSDDPTITKISGCRAIAKKVTEL